MHAEDMMRIQLEVQSLHSPALETLKNKVLFLGFCFVLFCFVFKSLHTGNDSSQK